MEMNRRPLLQERVEALEMLLDSTQRHQYHRVLQQVINRNDGFTTLSRVRASEAGGAAQPAQQREFINPLREFINTQLDACQSLCLDTKAERERVIHTIRKIPVFDLFIPSKDINAVLKAHSHCCLGDSDDREKVAESLLALVVELEKHK